MFCNFYEKVWKMKKEYFHEEMTLLTYDTVAKLDIHRQNFTPGRKVTSFMARAPPLLFS